MLKPRIIRVMIASLALFALGFIASFSANMQKININNRQIKKVYQNQIIYQNCIQLVRKSH